MSEAKEMTETERETPPRSGASVPLPLAGEELLSSSAKRGSPWQGRSFFSRGLHAAVFFAFWGGLFALGASAFWLALFALCMAGGACESWSM